MKSRSHHDKGELRMELLKKSDLGEEGSKTNHR
jgi:hypothetical protein